ncbi:hypothetical protein CROQUDRAFT_93885 [Cronartium quercuum f. sp. fusiforme G11]|uniref:Uncharacterized protein n=1 Tax=Cronartium quercuum f. sp. fusiforme G11 TaxID=708437 RepID=A0A9P6NG85_9BASI|nr:hypothetical protein CROQUDRAFT_93885 [Cronartium quercuum f. sp. fusiforme G11]
MVFTSLFTRSHSSSKVTSSPPTTSRTLPPSLNLHHPFQNRQRENTLLSITNQPTQGTLKKKGHTTHSNKSSCKVYRPKTSRGLSFGNKENIHPLYGPNASSYPPHHESQAIDDQISTGHNLYPPITLHESSERERLKRPDVVLSTPEFITTSGMGSKTQASRPLLRVEYTPPFQLAPQRRSPSSISSGQSSNATSFSTIASSHFSESSPRQMGSRSNTYLGTYLGPSIQNELEPDGSWVLTGRIHSPLSHTSSASHSILNQDDEAMKNRFEFEKIQAMEVDEVEVINPNEALESIPKPMISTKTFERFNDDQGLDGRWTHGTPYQAFTTCSNKKNKTATFFPFQHLE